MWCIDLLLLTDFLCLQPYFHFCLTIALHLLPVNINGVNLILTRSNDKKKDNTLKNAKATLA